MKRQKRDSLNSGQLHFPHAFHTGGVQKNCLLMDCMKYEVLNVSPLR